MHLVVGTILYHAMSAKLYHEFDQRLMRYTTCLVDLLPDHRGIDLGLAVKEMSELSGVSEGLYVHIVDSDGRLIYASSSVTSADAAKLRVAADATPNRPATIRLPDLGTWRIVRREAHRNGRLEYIGHVAIPFRNVQQALGHLMFILAILFPGVVILASLGAWVLLKGAMAPLRRAIQTIQAIQAQDFNRRLPVPRTGDEVQALAETFNEMIGRLDCSFSQMRQFILDASHELRTPLAILKGEIEVGLTDQACSHVCQPTLGTCTSEINRMSRLVETLLFLSSVDGAGIDLERKPLHLRSVVEEMVENARVLGEMKHLQIELLDGCDPLVSVNEMKFKQLLLNLIDNAVKYTPSKGRITISCQVYGGQVELAVADTGCGIAAEDLPRIFDRFYRVDKSRSRVDGGYGLGLAICKGIAEAHHGTIHVESSLGKGSTFYVRLPLIA